MKIGIVTIIDYINYGGYPEVVFSEKIRSNPSQYIKNDIIDKVLLRDLPSLYGITDIQELNKLFVHIAFRSGNEFSYEKLSTEAGIKKDTIKRYLEYLEAAFLIKVVNRIDQNAKRLRCSKSRRKRRTYAVRRFDTKLSSFIPGRTRKT